MKIRQKVISGLLGTFLAVGLIGYISKMTHSEVKQNASIISENIKKEVKGATEIYLVLQNTQINIHNLLELKTSEIALSNIKHSPKINQVQQQQVQKEIQDNIANFEHHLQLNKKYTASKIQTIRNLGDTEAIKEWHEQIVELDKLNIEFLAYKKYIYQFIELIDNNSISKASHLEILIKEQYKNKLSIIIAKYKDDKEQEVISQSTKIIETINVANQQIITLTIVILVTSIFLYSLILGSVLKSITYLTDAAYKVRQGKLDTRVKINSKDELGILAKMFNQMMDDLNKTSVSISYIDNILNSINDMLVVINLNAIIIKVNKSTTKVLGYQEAELIGKPIKFILRRQESADELWIHELIEKDGIANIERIYLTKDGREIPVSFSPSVMRDHNGETQGLVCVAQDISERKRAEEANVLLATAIEYAADAIEITDTEARFKYVNPAFEKTTGYTRAEVVGKTSASVLRSDKHDAAFYQQMSNTIASGKVWSGSYIGKRKDGSLYYQEATISPVRNSAGKIIHHVAVKRDITERKRLEESLAKINECFLNFGTDPTENINQLTTICGELLGATSTLYSRIEKGMLCLVGKWQFSTTYNVRDNLDGRICYDVIQQGSNNAFVVKDLASTTYAQTDLNVISYGWKTYIGQAVKCQDIFIGSLCAVYENDVIPSDADKTVIGIIAAAIAVEEERRWTQEALKESEERYALAVRAANDGLWDWNLITNEIYFSPRCKSMLGYESNEIGNSLEECFKRVHPDDIEQLKAALSAHLEGVTPHFENEHRRLHKDGSYRWILCRGLAVRDVDGKPYRIAGSQTDITDRKQAEEQLRHNAFYDALTQLPNRVLFMDKLSHAIARAKQSDNYLFAVLFLDLDRFKVINDSLGHLVGDQLLIAIARRVETCLRAGDTFARLGGDEFTILLDNIHDVEDAIQVSDRILQELTLPFNLNGHEVFTTASIGIALSTTNYDQPEDLLRDADTTMYRAKAGGKARFEIFDATMRTQAVARLQLETDLQWALKRQEFQLYYQPIVSLHTGRITGFEALVRLCHPVRGMVLPTEFIPLMEETGLIVPLGYWVLREACRQLKTWQMQFPATPLTISINLSSKQLLQPDLIEQIKQILQETNLEPRSLGLEITESAIIENAEAAAIMLSQLQRLGVRLYMDDFGTGYSSLSYLHRFPIDTLKIDRSFISNMSVDTEKIEIIRTVVTLAGNLSMNVVAEGVETNKQMHQLKALNCEFGQGYFFAKPLNSEMAEALIAVNLPQYLAI